MISLSERIIKILVKKKILMERYLKNPLFESNELFTIINEYDNWKNNYFKECDDIGFEKASLNHKDRIMRVIIDVVRYYDNEIKHCSISEISDFLIEKRKVLLKTWEDFEILINN